MALEASRVRVQLPCKEISFMDQNNKPRLFLLDAYALIFRAYYALIKMPRTTSTGLNTSAVFGFVGTLEELLRKERPTHMAVCFDPQGPTFRHEAYEAYKGEREATPEDIKLSIPIIKDIIRAYRIPILEVPGFEADDVIGSMALKAGSQGFETYMMTPDKDFGQLVSPDVFQYKPAYRGGDFEVRGPEQVCERYGISEPASGDRHPRADGRQGGQHTRLSRRGREDRLQARGAVRQRGEPDSLHGVSQRGTAQESGGEHRADSVLQVPGHHTHRRASGCGTGGSGAPERGCARVAPSLP